MKTTIKLPLLAILLFAFSAGLKAQDKYEYATISYSWEGAGQSTIGLSTNNGAFTKIALPASDKKAAGLPNTSPALQWINDNGWDIVEYFPYSNARATAEFLLRKKKQ